MFEELLKCKIEELQVLAEKLAEDVNEENAELFIRTLWKRFPELTVEQEKELHKLGRKVRKRFHMKTLR